MTTVYLVTGPTGAGKTTHARQLCAQTGGLRFSIDEWMAALFQADTPDPLTFEWAIERVERCEAQIRAVCQQALSAGTNIVLDLGFTTADQRQRFRQWAAGEGAKVVLHHVSADPATRHQRVQHRNQDRSETFAFEVTDAMFDFMEKRFQAPSAQENAVSFSTD